MSLKVIMSLRHGAVALSGDLHRAKLALPGQPVRTAISEGESDVLRCLVRDLYRRKSNVGVVTGRTGFARDRGDGPDVLRQDGAGRRGMDGLGTGGAVALGGPAALGERAEMLAGEEVASATEVQ